MSDPVALLIYICGFAVAAVFFLWSSKFEQLSKKGLSLVFLIMSIVAAVGISSLHYVAEPTADYHDYIRFSERATMHSYVDYTEKYTNIQEPTFYAISNISWGLTDGPFLMFAIYQLLIVSFVVIGIRKLDWLTPHQKVIAFVFFLFMIFPFSFSNPRNIVSVAILFYATLMLLKNHKIRNFLVWSIAAILFHYSSIIPICIILALFLCAKKTNWLDSKNIPRHMLMIIGISFCWEIIVWGIAQTPLLPQTFSVYMANSDSIWLNAGLDSGTGMVMALTRTALALGVIYLTLIPKHGGKDALGVEMPFLYGCTLAYLLMNIPSNIMLMSMRVGRFFELFLILFAFFMINNTPRGGSRKMFIYILILAVAAFSFVGVEYIMNRHWLFPYETIWSHL